jgi:hypothetical protein
MSMRELLRVSLTAEQLKEACAEWARSRTTLPEPTDTEVVVGDGGADVLFRRKRAPRKKNGAQP